MMTIKELMDMDGCIVSDADIEEANQIVNVIPTGYRVVDRSYKDFDDYQRENMEPFKGKREYVHYWYNFTIFEDGIELPMQANLYVPTK